MNQAGLSVEYAQPAKPVRVYFSGGALSVHLCGQLCAQQELIGRGPLEPVRPFVPDLLKGKHALVTGGNRGIGEAITVALVKAGAKVCVMANSEE